MSLKNADEWKNIKAVKREKSGEKGEKKNVKDLWMKRKIPISINIYRRNIVSLKLQMKINRDLGYVFVLF